MSKRCVANGDYEARLHPEAAAAGIARAARLGLRADLPVSCPAARRCGSHPIGTGPFKFVEFKPNERIRLTRNPDYWKPGRPYLDGIEYTIIPNRSTAILAFIAGKFDLTWPYDVAIPLVKDIKAQAPQAICEVGFDQRQPHSRHQPRRRRPSTIPKSAGRWR